jgi:hypothetical protein
MTLLACWLLFPLVLGLLSVGCGLLLEQAAGVRLPGTLLAPAGLAVIIVAAAFATMTDATAELAVPGVVALAVAGFALSFPLRARRLDRWALVAVAAAFAAYAAPIVLSGQATFAGYITLDDTATWLAMTDRVMDHGRSMTGLAPSSYEATLANYLAAGSPVGSNLPLGLGAKLVGQDVAWLFQPYLAFLGAMLALGAYELAARLVASRALRALSAFVASQPALLYAYALWSGIKELAAAAIIVLLAALIAPALEGRARLRGLLPPAAASAALLSVLTVGGVVWLAALLVPALAVGIRLRGRALATTAAAFAAFALALSMPSLMTASVFIRGASKTNVFTSSTELGNLGRPLDKLQLFGIWPASDFRVDPKNVDGTHVLIAVVIASALLGLAWSWRRRGWELLLYVAGVSLGCAAIISRGSPWVDAKALATGSPAFALAGLVGGAWLFERGRRTEAVVVVAAIAGGVLWSNALAYHDAWLAPRAQLAELQRIGNRFAGEGPTLMTEFQPYGVRHFLRDMDPEGASELRRRQIPLRNGQLLHEGFSADVDEFQVDALLVYRSLVLRRSGLASRPPSTYALVWRGRYYEVWQRRAKARAIVEHLPLGSPLEPVAAPSCGTVLRLAGRAAAEGGLLATVMRPRATVVQLSRASYPATWRTSGDPNIVVPTGRGTLEADVDLAGTGRYALWLGGSVRGHLELTVDGRLAGSSRDQLNTFGEYTPLGEVRLPAGVHRLTLRYGGADLHPGSGGGAFPIGPIVLSRGDADRPVTYVRPGNARMLCGKSLDWVEALGA